MSRPNGTTPLTTRQMQELLRGNHRNMVSVQIRGEYVCSIERSLAQHFSQVWGQRLDNKAVSIVHATFSVNASAGSPGNAPIGNASVAPSANALVAASDSVPSGGASLSSPPSLAAYPLERVSVKFLVQWMRRGGADPVGLNALVYPQGNPVALGKLHQLATSLEIDALIARTAKDLESTKHAFTKQDFTPSSLKLCYRCGEQGHVRKTCKFCNYCKTTGHLIKDCTKRAEAEKRRQKREREHLEFLEREQRRQEKAKREQRQHLEFLDRERRREEKARRDTQGKLRKAFREGKVAITDSEEKYVWLS